MKKISFIFVLMTLFFGLFNSCELDDDDFIGPKNKWCCKEFQYTDDEGNTSCVDCYFLYSDGTYSPASTLVDNNNFDFTEEGLTVVAIPRLDTPLYSKLNNKYVVKTFKAGTKYNDDGEENASGKFSMRSTLWTAICVLNPSLVSTASKAVPQPLKVNSGYTELTDLTNFSWKKITAQFLVDKLLSE